MRKQAAKATHCLLATLSGKSVGSGCQYPCHLGQNSFSTVPQAPAFVFDIDGVLVRGKTVLESARRALTRLYSGDGQEPRYPVCFLTNGGGVLESEKADQLAEWLGVQVQEDQVVLSHTPFRQLAETLHSTPVLVAGRHDIPRVAASYGFQKVVTSAALAASCPHAAPFAAGLADVSVSEHGTEDSPIQAILVFSDPADWYLDLQLMTELITSGGVMGRPVEESQSSAVKMYFSNPDKVFANEYASPRFGQGAFAVALRALLKEVAGHNPTHWKVFGKPNPEPYQLAHEILIQQAKRLGLPSSDAQSPLSSIYMVGDNPDSDIAGARSAGLPWRSILVRTGVFSGHQENSSVHPADHVVENVADAVELGLHSSRMR